MTVGNIDASINEGRNFLHQLFNAKHFPITDVAKNLVPEASVPGVYAITQHGMVEILYVGKNDTVTIYNRSWQHVNGRSGSDLYMMVKLYPDLAQDVANYRIRWIQVDDPSQRHYFEAFAIGVLKPRMNFKKNQQMHTEATSETAPSATSEASDA